MLNRKSSLHNELKSDLCKCKNIILHLKKYNKELQEKILNYEWEVFRQKFSNINI